MTVNALSAVVALLRADAVVAAAVGNVTVYGQSVPAITGEIDDKWDALMPRRVVLVREAGGLAKDELSPLGYPRIDVRCYGKDPGGVWDASELSRVVYEQLQGAQDKVEGIGAITMAAGPTSGREPDTEWAYNLRTYDVLGEG